MKRSYKDDAANFFDDRARDSGHILKLRFRSDIRKKLFPIGVLGGEVLGQVVREVGELSFDS